jgi:hypothetical protein
MRTRLELALEIAVIVTAALSLPARAQTGAATPRGGGSAGRIPDLTGTWGHDERQGFLEGIAPSISMSDPLGSKRGKEDDIPYQPWALQKTMSEVSSFDQFGHGGTDPWTNYCEPLGLLRIYIAPARTKFVQTPDAVYILHEAMQMFRIVRLNSKHPEDPDPTWWGDSIGSYENGDTLVVDTIGVNDKTWLDEFGRPHTEKMHLIERYKRVDADTLDLDATIDDPGAYTKPFKAHRTFRISKVPFMQNPWVCSVRENQKFYDISAQPATAPPKK